VPREKLVIPKFNSEKAEKAWWLKNLAAVEADLRIALRESQGAPAREVMTKGHKRKLLPANVRLVGTDLDAARKIAEDRGIAYDAYIRALLK
jgi:predicted DNA binding CopG/RHH family protein